VTNPGFFNHYDDPDESDNKWPPGVKGAYGNGLDGIENAIGDATADDGDKSDWELGPAPVVVAQ